MTVIIGIDPGLKGGISVFSAGVLTSALPMPTFKQKIIDWGSIIAEVEESDFVVLEEQFIKPTSGLAQRGMAKTMRNFGTLEGILLGIGVPHQAVKAQAWKSLILAGTAKDKAAAIQYCQSRYPHVSLLPTPRSRAPSDGIADAICIGEYAVQLAKKMSLSHWPDKN